MKLKWQQNYLRMQHLKQRIYYCRALVDLAKQNMVLCDEREKRQQQLVTDMNEILERMEAELETLKNRWRQLKVEQRIREVKWGLVWRSRLLMGAPHSRQMLERTNWMGNLEVLGGKEEGELINKMACKKKHLKKWKRTTLMERAALKVIKDDFLHHQQYLQLSKTLDREMARLQNLVKEDEERNKAAHPC